MEDGEEEEKGGDGRVWWGGCMYVGVVAVWEEGTVCAGVTLHEIDVNRDSSDNGGTSARVLATASKVNE